MPSKSPLRRVHPRKRPCWRRAVTSAMGHKPKEISELRYPALAVFRGYDFTARSSSALVAGQVKHQETPDGA
jgi:hypothetical protein